MDTLFPYTTLFRFLCNADGPGREQRQTRSKAMKVLYKTEASATGGRTGSAKTADGAFAVTLTTPKELGGPGGEGNNPEQLFAAGYSACFLGAIKFAAGKQKVDRKSVV